MSDQFMPISPHQSLRSIVDSAKLHEAGSNNNSRQIEQIEQSAKQFESVLLGKMMESMRSTVFDSELTSDGASKQVMDMFYMFLGEDISEKGGFGLWKTIAKMYEPSESKSGMMNNVSKMEFVK